MLDIVVYFVLSTAFVILSSLFFAYCFRKSGLRFEQVLPISLMSTALLMLLLTAMFHNIWLSFILTLAGQLIGLAVFIICDKQRLKTITQFLRSPALVVFVVLLAGLFVVNYGRILTGFDDLIHWGPFVADMLRLNDFYNSSANIAFSVHGDYPPAAALFEVFYLKLTAHEDWLMFVAIQVLCLAMLFPLLSHISWRKKAKWTSFLNIAIVLGLIVAGFLSVGLQANSAFFYEIRIDTLLACTGAYSIYLAFTEGREFTLSTLIRLSIAITFMLLLKQVALVLAAVAVLIYLVTLFAHRRSVRPFWRQKPGLEKVSWSRFAVILVVIAMPMAFLKLWDIQVEDCLNNQICTQQFSSSEIQFLEVPAVVLGLSGSPLQQETASHFLSYISTGSTLINSDVLSITYPQFILLFIGTMLWLAVYARKKKQSAVDVLVVAGAVLVGYFVYLYVLLGTYLYGGFSDGEMQILASADRYIGTYILMMILVMIAVYVEVWGRGAGKASVKLFASGGIILLALCLVLSPIAYKSILPYKFLNYSKIYPMSDFKAPLDAVVTAIKSDRDFSQLSVVVLAECSEQAGLWESNWLRYQLRPNPYLVLQNGQDAQFVRNTDYSGAPQYIDPAGRSNTNDKNGTTVYVIAMCSGAELEKYNDQQAKLIRFDDTTGIKEKWQVFKTTVDGDYYNTLDQELENLQAI